MYVFIHVENCPQHSIQPTQALNYNHYKSPSAQSELSFLQLQILRMGAVNKDSVLGGSVVLSLVSLVLLLGVTCYFQASLTVLQQQVTELQEQEKAKVSCSQT